MLYSFGIFPMMFVLKRFIDREIERDAVVNLYEITSKRNILLLLFAIGLAWPGALMLYVTLRITHRFLRHEPPDDGDDPPVEVPS